MSSTASSLLAVLVAVVLAGLLAIAGGSGGLQMGGVPVFVWCVVLAFVMNWLAFIPAFLARTERFYDLFGATTYLTVTVFALTAGNRSSTAVLLTVMIGVWAARLGSFLFIRVMRDGSDGRFDTIKQSAPRFLMSWTLQGLWVSMTAGAAFAAMTTADEPSLGVLSFVGAAVWAAGLGIEVTADLQKNAFRSEESNRGRFITSGIWAWSRHPNYFGEITLWVGVALVALPTLKGWQYVTLVSPLFVTLLLTKISGIPMLEARGKKRWGDDPAYREYIRSTPVLVLRPPSNDVAGKLD